MVSDQYARADAWQPRQVSPSSNSATGSASCALTSLPKRWSPCRGPSQSPFPPRWFWSLAVVGGMEIRQTLLLRLGNPCLLVLEILIPIPEILTWAAGRRADPPALGLRPRKINSPRVVDLNALIVDYAKVLRSLLGDNVELCVVVSPSPLTVKADSAQLAEVLMNLGSMVLLNSALRITVPESLLMSAHRRESTCSRRQPIK